MDKKKGLRKLLKFDKKDIPWVFFCAVIIILALLYRYDMAVCKEVIKEPCEYCKPYQQMVNPTGEDIPSEILFNISIPST